MIEQNDWLATAPAMVREELSRVLNAQERAEFAYHWGFFARLAQLPPEGEWRIWLILAGRGFGKTRAGSEWVRSIAEGNSQARIALVSSSLAEARSVMVEGESGIIACCPPERRPVFEPSLRRLCFPNGTQAQLFSAAEPELLRGPQHTHAWCDEVCKWPLAHERATRCWDNLLMGLRLGSDPRIAVTTTPRSVPLITRILEQEENGEAAVTRGSTYDNSINLPQRFLAAIEGEFAGSQQARQEIDGEILTDVEGALWTRSMVEHARETGERPDDARVVVAVDPPASANGDACGIIACCPPERRPVFEPSLRRLRFPNGAQAQLFSAAEPELLRGPQHTHAWCDEVCKWPLAHERATRCWDNLLMGLRLGSDPRIAVTTTPRSVPLITRILEQEENGEAAVTRGSTYDNSINLPQRFLAAIEGEFAGSQQARQEIDGEILTDVEGALWTRSMVEHARETGERPDDARVVVAVDPPASANGDACGIIVAALGQDQIGRVLADCTIEQASPEQWARRVAAAAEEWNADRVVAEANQGGAMVSSVLRAANNTLPIKLVHASRGKVARAEPVAALYETGRVRHCGLFPQLEDQICGLKTGGEYAGPGRSPDRADALVWALTELMLGPSHRPRVLPI